MPTPLPTDRYRLEQLHKELVNYLVRLRSHEALLGPCYDLVLARPYLDVPADIDSVHSWWKKEPWSKLLAQEVRGVLIRQGQELLEKVEDLLEATATGKPPTNALTETLDKIPHATKGAKLLNYLHMQRNKTATVLSVCKEIYKTTSKSQVAKTHKLVRDNRKVLEKEGAPLTIIRDGVNFKLVENRPRTT
jgi:hypothetical protein